MPSHWLVGCSQIRLFWPCRQFSERVNYSCRNFVNRIGKRSWLNLVDRGEPRYIVSRDTDKHTSSYSARFREPQTTILGTRGLLDVQSIWKILITHTLGYMGGFADRIVTAASLKGRRSLGTQRALTKCCELTLARILYAQIAGLLSSRTKFCVFVEYSSSMACLN